MLFLKEADDLAGREEQAEDGEKRAATAHGPLEHKLRVSLHRGREGARQPQPLPVLVHHRSHPARPAGAAATTTAIADAAAISTATATITSLRSSVYACGSVAVALGRNCAVVCCCGGGVVGVGAGGGRQHVRSIVPHRASSVWTVRRGRE